MRRAMKRAILAALEHRGEVVDGRVGIGAAHRLDERGGEVVVRVAGLVVDERPLARRVLDVRLRERLARGLRGLRRELEDVQRGARVAAGARARSARRSSSGSSTPSAAAPRRDDRLEVLVRQRLELVQLHPREQRRVDLEVRVLGRRADQRDQPLLDRRAAARPAAPC